MNEESDATIEISGARPGELDAVLEVMCEAFELPFAVARPIFYDDPYFDPENKRVLRVAGRIVSCLTITEAEYWIGQSIVKIAGIAGLSTRPEARRHGYAARLLEATVQTLDARGYALTGLFPYDYAYYRRLGWETASAVYRYTASPSCLPGFHETVNTKSALLNDRSAIQPARREHQAAIERLHHVNTQGRTLHALRDAKRWRYLEDRIPIRLVCINTAGEVEGYLFAETRPGTMRIGTENALTLPTFRVMEFCANTPDARRRLIGYLAAQKQVGHIEYDSAAAALMESGLLSAFPVVGAGGAFANVDSVAGVMLRVLGFFRLLTALRPNWEGFNGQVALTLHNEMRPEHSSAFILSGEGQGLPDIKEAAFLLPPSSLSVEGDMRVWAQVAVGHISGEDACALGLLRAGTSEAARLVAELFPYRAPFLPAPDHF